MEIVVLAAILLMSQGIQSQENVSWDQLRKLNDVVTSRLKESLQKARLAECSSTLMMLQQAVELPISQLANKIEAFNIFNRSGSPASLNGTLSKEEPGLRQGNKGKDKNFEKRVLKLLRKLGIYDNFTTRVFNAIFSDEKQLKKLKKKLDELGKQDKAADQDDLWSFVHELF
ncbi:uncharacterized protein LOC119547722 [Drosophila subpulchrella]|uniref:uncharacterized protein LOC119547722 n=1 Tax=Drosophila subpulchrella TaxID=1486046 RepID=UPI0018A191D7|nr:uncharacterized protein LOC119547722 [Drosophila subpulchrella]